MIFFVFLLTQGNYHGGWKRFVFFQESPMKTHSVTFSTFEKQKERRTQGSDLSSPLSIASLFLSLHGRRRLEKESSRKNPTYEKIMENVENSKFPRFLLNVLRLFLLLKTWMEAKLSLFHRHCGWRSFSTINEKRFVKPVQRYEFLRYRDHLAYVSSINAFMQSYHSHRVINSSIEPEPDWNL